MAIKINLGCGNDIRKGWVNVDCAPLTGVDVVHDLNVTPLPFESQCADEIVCEDVLEHVDYVPILKECHRILIPGGLLNISVPHFTSNNNYVDPTHRKMFSVKTFNFFCENTFERKMRSYYFDFCFSSIERRIVFSTKGFFIYNRPVQFFANLSHRAQTVYEATAWSRLFPADNLRIKLRK